MTLDVDVTVDVGPEKVRPLVEALLRGGFAARTDDLEAFFARARVVPLVHKRTRKPLDLVVARDSLGALFLRRAKRADLGGFVVPAISPEDLVIAKLFAGRPRDLEDVRAVVTNLGDQLNLRHLRDILGQLDEAEDRADLLPTFERFLRERERGVSTP